MPLELLYGDNGDVLKVLKIHKNRYAGVNFNENSLNNMPSAKLRDDDILLCSYAKSGCHWLWENVRALRNGQLYTDQQEKESTMMEFHDFEYMDQLPSPRILNNHCFFDDQPTDLLKGKVKLVFMYRNPKDILTSFYHHHKNLAVYLYNGNFNDYVKRFAQGKVSNNSVFDYWNSWEKGLKDNPQIPHIVVSFEGLKQNPILERRRIATFLGKSYSDEFLQSVADATSINSMRKQKCDADEKYGGGSAIMYRKGEVGDWKNHFTVSNNEWFDSVIQEKMADSSMFNFVYSL